MPYQPHTEFSKLYKTYTSDPDSIGKHLTDRMVELTDRDPLLVITGADAVLFPGANRPAVVESFRKSTRGFIELAAISHLGTALPWIIRLRELTDPRWREDAIRLLEQIERTRRINTEDLWRNEIAVAALSGLETKIVDMIDYSCRVTASFIHAGLANESLMNFQHLRAHYLEPVGSAEVPVPINDMMVATFALAFLDIAHRIISWMRAQVTDWGRLMVMLSGRSGRPTAGLTWETNNMCHLVWKAAHERLPLEHVYIAPHAPSFVLADIQNEDQLRGLNRQFREIWNNTRASVEIARKMFEGYPQFEPARAPTTHVDPGGRQVVHDMPSLRSPEDRFTAIARLRITMEDPRQLLANSVASYIIDQLCECDNHPERVFIPGFTNVTYPGKEL
jgi:Domain of unknown function (DUF5624)